MSGKIVIHVIDDDAAMRDSLAFLLDVNGFKPQVYESADTFLKEMSVDAARCVVSDIRLPGMTGVELVRNLKGSGSSCPVILITGHGDVALAVEAMKAGAADFIEKPFDDETLLGQSVPHWTPAGLIQEVIQFARTLSASRSCVSIIPATRRRRTPRSGSS